MLGGTGKNTLRLLRKNTLATGKSRDWKLADQSEAAAAVQVGNDYDLNQSTCWRAIDGLKRHIGSRLNKT